VNQGLEGWAGEFVVFPMFRKGIPEGNCAEDDTPLQGFTAKPRFNQ